MSGSYFPNQGPVPVPPQQQQQVRGPTISENVLNNNPDFQFSRWSTTKRRVNPGFVPVAARYNNNNNNSTTGSLIGGPGNKNQNASALMEEEKILDLEVVLMVLLDDHKGLLL